MNKLELINKLSEENGLAKPVAQQIVELFFDAITRALTKGERVEIRGLCSFYVKKYKGYKGRNPKTGEIVIVKAKRLPFFKCGKALRRRVDRTSPFPVEKAKRVLIIDDNEKLCNVFGEWLREYFPEDKLKLYFATDALTGIELARKTQPDLIVLDVVLDSEISGKDVYERLTSDPSIDNTRFIFISGQLAYRPDSEIFIRKPIDWFEFIRTVAALTGLQTLTLRP